jgi:glycerophosphoryl diester phosphodiesterase
MLLKIGHRGAMGYAPENTLLSFKKALELKVDAVELDVYVCKTGELVVIHDDKVDRTTDGHGYVTYKTFEELRNLDAGQGEKIPTLEEVFDLIDRKVKVNIELKGTRTAQPVFELIENYVKNKCWNYDDFLISSFNHYELKRFNELNPEVKIGALITGIPIGFAEFAEKVNASSVNLCIEFINQAFVDDAHERGLNVFVWTVNDLDDIERMKQLGVDGIFSNFPDRL